jgi:putative OPT family oligopeptide transporter
MNEMQPYIAANRSLPEITLKVILISIVLAFVLAMSNAYLALKVGLLTSASIPAAIISFGILKFFRNANILENNLIQTAASAGEAVAGGIVYTIPALILIHYWQHFPYWQCFLIALTSGALGVLFSIPLRQILVNDDSLHFPEGKAIAEVLIVGTDHQLGLREILMGGLFGGLIELLQTGFKLIASQWQLWIVKGRTLMGFGFGFSPTMIGAGYLIGFDMGMSIFAGALLGWGLSIPILSHFSSYDITLPSRNVMALWQSNIRYVGVGAMLIAGLWTLITLLKPVGQGLMSAMKLVHQPTAQWGVARTQRDLPIHYVIMGSLFFLVLIFLLLEQSLPLQILRDVGIAIPVFLTGSIFYIAVIGFLVCAITGYFSGLVGVTASPGSAVLIACLLMTCLLLQALLHAFGNLSHGQWVVIAAIPIFFGALLTGIGAIANDNLQDLKVGQLVGATPWKQQVMLLIGVAVAALIIPVVMELLFQAYGIGDVVPQAGMDFSQTLPAPPAAMMAAVTQGIFNHELPWRFFLIGAGIAVIASAVSWWLKRRGKRFSVLAFAVGIYLPLGTSMALVVGSVMARCLERLLKHHPAADRKQAQHRTTVFACGLVAGSALMDVLLAAPFAFAHNPNLFDIAPHGWQIPAGILGAAVVILLGYNFWRIAQKPMSG